MTTKKCTKCGETKSTNEFHKSSAGKHGVIGQCKTCRNETNKAWRENNREKYLATTRTYRENNREKCRAACKVWRDNNKEKIAGYHRSKESVNAYMRKRRAEDKGFRLLDSLRTRLNQAIRRSPKADTTRNLLGCTTEELCAHLESQFTDGMSWDNYGRLGWHIDHITPCASFDLSDPEQQRECFHYTNLQPLWWQDNRRKSDKIL
jgi:hypothetical protein